MLEPSGNYRMLSEPTLPADAPAGTLLVYGTEAEVAAMATRVRLGADVQGKRTARRKAQRASRKRNR